MRDYPSRLRGTRQRPQSHHWDNTHVLASARQSLWLSWVDHERSGGTMMTRCTGGSSVTRGRREDFHVSSSTFSSTIAGVRGDTGYCRVRWRQLERYDGSDEPASNEALGCRRSSG